jgi:hypothetical protein
MMIALKREVVKAGLKDSNTHNNTEMMQHAITKKGSPLDGLLHLRLTVLPSCGIRTALRAPSSTSEKIPKTTIEVMSQSKQ